MAESRPVHQSDGCPAEESFNYAPTTKRNAVIKSNHGPLALLIAFLFVAFAAPGLAFTGASFADQAQCEAASADDLKYQQYDDAGPAEATPRGGGHDSPDDVYDANGPLCVDVVEVCPLGEGWGAAKRGGRGKNNLKPDTNATGSDSTWKTDADGNITGHAEWKPNPQNPSGFDDAKRVDLKGDPHFNKVAGQDVSTPHAHGKDIPGGVRPASPGEIPGGGN